MSATPTAAALATLLAYYAVRTPDGELTARLLRASCGYVIEMVADSSTIGERVTSRRLVGKATALSHYTAAQMGGMVLLPLDSDPPFERVTATRTVRQAALRALVDHPNQVVTVEEIGTAAGKGFSRQAVSRAMAAERHYLPIVTCGYRGYMLAIALPTGGDDSCSECSACAEGWYCQTLDHYVNPSLWCGRFDRRTATTQPQVALEGVSAHV